MLKWISRSRVEKGDGHVTWVDLYEDTETKIQYFSIGNNLSPRYDCDGSLKIGG